MYGNFILSAENKYYVTIAGGSILIFLLFIWIVALVRILLSGQANRLQKKYGTENDIRKEKKKRNQIFKLVLLGIILLCLFAVYYIYL